MLERSPPTGWRHGSLSSNVSRASDDPCPATHRRRDSPVSFLAWQQRVRLRGRTKGTRADFAFWIPPVLESGEKCEGLLREGMNRHASLASRLLEDVRQVIECLRHASAVSR